MLRYLGCIGLAGLVLVIGIAFSASGRRVHEGPVYSVAEVRAHLADNPGTWVGRAVWVRGVAGTCPTSSSQGEKLLGCQNWPPDLFDPGPAGAKASLPLVWGSQDGVRALLRRVPLLSGLIPPAPTPRWWVLATYRVRLQAAAEYVCGTTPCYEALLDAAP